MMIFSLLKALASIFLTDVPFYQNLGGNASILDNDFLNRQTQGKKGKDLRISSR
jgi:hypothetical protein